jgi:hypothetical protein
VVTLPPKVTFNQSSWSPESGWTGSPPPSDLADQIKAVVEGAFQQNVGQQAEAYRQTGGAGPVLSAAALLTTGQRLQAEPTGTHRRPALLAVGLPLTCAVDPADPAHRYVVDWDAPLIRRLNSVSGGI